MPRRSRSFVPTTELGKALFEKRAERHLNDVAAEIGVKQNTIGRLEHGLHQPSAATALKLAKWLGWSVERVVAAASREAIAAAPVTGFVFTIPITVGLDENQVWMERVSPALAAQAPNVRDIFAYAFQEMFNNVIEHSGGAEATVGLERENSDIVLVIQDNGVGIFRKIREAFALSDDQHAILELAKGKLTTMPDHHSGEGIFFSSRMFDRFTLSSGRVVFRRTRGGRDIVFMDQGGEIGGTAVKMVLSADSKVTCREVFDTFSDPDSYGFTRTHIFVGLAQYEGEKLLSRSQARRLLARFERFQYIVLDFTDVEEIGQAFADEIFRVFVTAHPKLTLHVESAGEYVLKMIRRTGWQSSANPE